MLELEPAAAHKGQAAVHGDGRLGVHGRGGFEHHLAVHAHLAGQDEPLGLLAALGQPAALQEGVEPFAGHAPSLASVLLTPLGRYVMIERSMLCQEGLCSRRHHRLRRPRRRWPGSRWPGPCSAPCGPSSGPRTCSSCRALFRWQGLSGTRVGTVAAFLLFLPRVGRRVPDQRPPTSTRTASTRRNGTALPSGAAGGRGPWRGNRDHGRRPAALPGRHAVGLTTIAYATMMVAYSFGSSTSSSST